MAGNLISLRCAAPNHHIILQMEETGVSLFIFEREDSPFPEQDYWFENKVEAMAVATQDFDVVDWQPTLLSY